MQPDDYFHYTSAMENNMHDPILNYILTISSYCTTLDENDDHLHLRILFLVGMGPIVGNILLLMDHGKDLFRAMMLMMW